VQLVLKFRNMLPNVIREELDNLVATIVAFWNVEHKFDGMHGDIHADSITIGGVPVIPGGGGSGSVDLPLHDKGDLLTRTDAALVALPVGSIGRVLTADPSAPEGLSWQIPPSGMNLDYLGDFASGPAYNDGDIVIGADGVAYMCVVDGTLTPPVPWPGQGVSINAAVDATYWVVSGHAALTNARVMSALANGYVKSTGGEPSTVAIIPVAEGGTGASTASAARTNLGIGTVGPVNLNGNANTYLNGAGAWTTPPQPAGVPTGAIVFFTTPCPAGYTRVSAWDGYYVRLGADNLTGGAASHTHAPGTFASQAHVHGSSALTVASHSHSSGTLAVAGHTHSIPSMPDHTHTFSATSSTGSQSYGVNAGSGTTVSQSQHTHSVSGTTGADGGQGAGTSGSAAPDVAGNTGSATAATVGNTDSAGALPITGASASATNNPLYVNFFACQKN
jgi:hypothetical protein